MSDRSHSVGSAAQAQLLLFVCTGVKERIAAAAAATKMSSKVQKIMVQPINLIFRYLQNVSEPRLKSTRNIRSRSSLPTFSYNFRKHECKSGCSTRQTCGSKAESLQGFDEFMNLVMDEAEEVTVKPEPSRKSLGRIMLRGDNITLIQSVSA
ncbi:hypothetical protein VTP01DRAFT_3618 [Rhizomucor pusillus]|uniref:uncharacterized protein n=1 Tax=Rhizomucor pusillus TaxID=4840 RepID=UPI0037423BB0